MTTPSSRTPSSPAAAALPLPAPRPRVFNDKGFTLVEILIAIVIIGILSTVTAFAVRGITDRGEKSACATDARVLVQAADLYLVQEHTDTIPATGTVANADRFEQTLVDAGLLKQVSSLYEMAADGSVSIEDAICT